MLHAPRTFAMAWILLAVLLSAAAAEPDDSWTPETKSLYAFATQLATKKASRFQLGKYDHLTREELEKTVREPVEQRIEQFKNSLPKIPDKWWRTMTVAQYHALGKANWKPAGAFNEQMTSELHAEIQRALASGRFREAGAYDFFLPIGNPWDNADRAEYHRQWVIGNFGGSKVRCEAYLESYQSVVERMETVFGKLKGMSWQCGYSEKAPTQAPPTAEIRIHPNQSPENTRSNAKALFENMLEAKAALARRLAGDENAHAFYGTAAYPEFGQYWNLNVDPDGNRVSVEVVPLFDGIPSRKSIKEIVAGTVEAYVDDLFSCFSIPRQGKDVPVEELKRRLESEYVQVESGKDFAYFFVNAEYGPEAVILARTPKHGAFRIEVSGDFCHLQQFSRPDERRIQSHLVQATADLLLQAFVGQSVNPELPAAEYRLELTADPTDLDTSFNNRSLLVASVVRRGTHGTDEPASGVAVKFQIEGKPALGKLKPVSDVLEPATAQTLHTNSEGKISLPYIAPSEKDLQEAGIDEDEVVVVVTAMLNEQVVDAVEFSISNLRNRIALEAEHPILPGHKNFFNKIRFKLNLPPRDIEAPNFYGGLHHYDVNVRCKHGAILKEVEDYWVSPEMGSNEIGAWSVWVGEEHAAYYHWVDPPPQKPVEEVVTIEVHQPDNYPELKGIPRDQLRAEVRFSVGIDLEIVDVKRLHTGNTWPGVPETLKIQVQDAFRPSPKPLAWEDLQKLFEVRDYQGKHLSSYFERPLVQEAKPWQLAPVDEDQFNALVKLWTWLEPELGKIKDRKPLLILPEHHDRFEWQPVRTPSGQYALMARNPEVTSKTLYPTLIWFQRGIYWYRVRALLPDSIDPNPANNVFPRGGTEAMRFDVVEYAGVADELWHTFSLPLIEVLMRIVVSVEFPYAVDVLVNTLDAISFGDDYEKNYPQMWYMLTNDMLDHLKLTGGQKVHSVFYILLCYARPTWEKWFQSQPERPGGSKQGREAAGVPLAEILKISQAVMRGVKSHTLVVMEREGLNDYAASLSDGRPLRPISDETPVDGDITRRIGEEKHFVIIPAMASETLRLDLKGQGGGRLIVVTSDTARVFQYPQNAWQESLVVDGAGNVLRRSGGPLDWRADQGLGPEPPGPPTPEPSGHDDQPSGAQPEAAATFHGKWDSQYGTVELRIARNEVRGRFGDDGKLSGTLSADGRVLTGKWGKAPTFRPPRHAGYFEFRLAPDARSFSARWWPADHEEAAKQWEAKRIE